MLDIIENQNEELKIPTWNMIERISQEIEAKIKSTKSKERGLANVINRIKHFPNNNKRTFLRITTMQNNE